MIFFVSPKLYTKHYKMVKYWDSFLSHCITGGNFIGLVKEQIISLANIDRLNELDAKYKKHFHDYFPKDISYVDHFSTDVYHCIWLKPSLTFKATTRPYSCLRKYKDPWKTLIAQHEAANHICPFSSSYVSSLFIILKADLSVLPCWVIDFWHLNSITVLNHFPLP